MTAINLYDNNPIEIYSVIESISYFFKEVSYYTIKAGVVYCFVRSDKNINEIETGNKYSVWLINGVLFSGFYSSKLKELEKMMKYAKSKRKGEQLSLF